MPIYTLKLEEVTELREQGLTYKEIAQELDSTSFVVGKMCRRYMRDLRYIALYRIPKEKIEDIKKFRIRGYKYKDISEKTGISVASILEICKKYCPGREYVAHRAKINEKLESRICFLIKDGNPVKVVSKRTGVGEHGIRNVMRRNGIQPIKRGRKLQTFRIDHYK